MECGRIARVEFASLLESRQRGVQVAGFSESGAKSA